MALFRRRVKAVEPDVDIARVIEAAQIAVANAELSTEQMAASYAQAVLADHDGGAGPLLDRAFDPTNSRAILKTWLPISRHAFIRNPMIQGACGVIAHYVWGQGVEVEARDPDLNEIAQTFIDDRSNSRALFGESMRSTRDSQLTYEGNIFFALFRSASTGQVRVRSIPTDQITDIWVNPDDATQPQFYRRRYARASMTTAGEVASESVDEWLPAYDYFPRVWPASIDGAPVRADTKRIGPVIYHLAVGGLADSQWGLPKTLAVLDWSNAYKNYLTDWASVARSLSRLAWRASTPRGKSSKLVGALESTLGVEGAGSFFDSNPAPVTGALAVMSDDVDLSPIGKSGAVLDADAAKALRLMVGSGMHLPDNILSGDPSGYLATASTLDRPTELAMKLRQTIWAEVYSNLITYALESSALSALGPGRAAAEYESDGRRIVTWPGDLDPTIDVRFPPLLSHDIKAAVDAVHGLAEVLDGRGADPDAYRHLLAREALSALGVDDIDDTLVRLFPEDQAPSQAAAAEARRVIEALAGR